MNPLLTNLGIFVLLVMGSGAFAHTDTRLTHKNGKLIGLPKQFQPASFDLKTKVLAIGKNKIDYSKAISKFFPKYDEYELRFSASWYHLSDTPPYMILEIRPKGKSYYFNLMFNMDTGEPIRFSIITTEKHKNISAGANHELKIKKYKRIKTDEAKPQQVKP